MNLRTGRGLSDLRDCLCAYTSQVLRDGVSCDLMHTSDAPPNPLLPFQLDPEPTTETLTAFGGLPLVAQTFRSLGLPQSVARHLRLKQRQRGLDEAMMIESFVLLNAAGGDCLEDFRRLAEDPGLPTLLGHARPLPDAARKFLYAFHRDAAIATAKAQRPADQTAFIPNDTEPLQGVAHVNVDLVRAVAARCPDQRIATIDQDATIHESHKREALPHYDGGRGYQPMTAVWAELNLVVADQFRDGNVPANFAPLLVAQAAFAALPSTFRRTSTGATRPVMNTNCSRGCAIPTGRMGRRARLGLVSVPA